MSAFDLNVYAIVNKQTNKHVNIFVWNFKDVSLTKPLNPEGFIHSGTGTWDDIVLAGKMRIVNNRQISSQCVNVVKIVNVIQ